MTTDDEVEVYFIQKPTEWIMFLSFQQSCSEHSFRFHIGKRETRLSITWSSCFLSKQQKKERKRSYRIVGSELSGRELAEARAQTKEPPRCIEYLFWHQQRKKQASAPSTKLGS